MDFEEQKYAYSQSQQLIMQCGSIGYLRGDFGRGGNAFYTTWNDFYKKYKTDEFKEAFDEVINSLRFDDRYDGFLKSRSTMSQYCDEQRDSMFQGNYCAEYGFRADTGKYVCLIRCNPNENDYNFYIYPYISQWLDKHMERAARGIRFIDSGYKELFRIEDGSKITVSYPDGEKSNRTCRYIDETHLQVDSDLFHICQFAEMMERMNAVCTPAADMSRHDSNDKLNEPEEKNYGR